MQVCCQRKVQHNVRSFPPPDCCFYLLATLLFPSPDNCFYLFATSATSDVVDALSSSGARVPGYPKVHTKSCSKQGVLVVEPTALDLSLIHDIPEVVVGAVEEPPLTGEAVGEVVAGEEDTLFHVDLSTGRL